MKKVYSIWVGGSEVNSYYIKSREVADEVADSWRAKGYDDVVVEEVELKTEDVCYGRDDLLSVAESIVCEWGCGDGEALCQVLADAAIGYLKSVR